MTESEDAAWRPIGSAPSDEDILIYTRPWGSIIARYSGEFAEWLSRMQVPVSIREDDEKPTHWRPLPAPPADQADAGSPAP